MQMDKNCCKENKDCKATQKLFVIFHRKCGAANTTSAAIKDNSKHHLQAIATTALSVQVFFEDKKGRRK